MKPISILAVILQLLIAKAVLADADAVWVIGGGPDVFQSQVQIERNVLWVLQAMNTLPGERQIRVFFTDGSEATPTPDIHEWSPPPDTAAAHQPLALVFDNYWVNGLRYRNHRIPDVAGTTEAAHLKQALRAELREEIVSFQGTLKREVLRRWPTAAAAYSLGFKAFLAEDLDAAQTFIAAQPEYSELWQRQARYLDQGDQALQLRRENNQFQKIAHLLRLARLKADLERDGPADLLERYRKLRECESAPF